MGRVKGSLKLSSNIEVLAGAPLDARSIVPLKTDLTGAETFQYSYVGMIVVVQEEAKLYILKAKPTTNIDNWVAGGSVDNLDDYYTKAEVDAIIASVYKPAGSSLFADLPEPSADVEGFVYNVRDAFTTTEDFAEGAGKEYPIGTNIVVINFGDDDTPDYKFDVLPGFIDLSGYQRKFVVDTLPTASEDEATAGNRYLYTGASVGDLQNGYIYKCVEDEENAGEYKWVPAPVQELGGSGSLADSLTAAVGAGGIEVGATYAAGTTYEKLWRDLLDPVMYPSFTAPSASLTTPLAKLLETGTTATTTFTVSFDRGSISPAYGTSGKRAGIATAYALNDGDPQTSEEFADVTVDKDNNTFTATVSYEAGEQPLDSTGANYDSALEAGSVTSTAVKFEFVDALYANTAAIGTVAKLALVSKSAKTKAFSFPAATIENPEVFDVPASWTVSAVEVLNTLSNTWEDCSSEFTITDTTHNDASDTEVEYKRYTCNLGYAMGARQVRIKWA